jgi:hypothetical protein
MGMFNILNAKCKCSSCSNEADFAIQFKYGYLRLLKYKLGDTLEWNTESKHSNLGIPSIGRVVVDGVSQNACPVCSHNSDFYIFVEKDTIHSVHPATSEYKFNVDTFIVLQE